MLRHVKVLLNQHNMRFPALNRHYHSVNGVHGYRPLPKRQFQVSEEILEARNSQSKICRLIDSYRKHGHKIATVNPISIKDIPSQSSIPELNPQFYGLSSGDKVNLKGLLHAPDHHQHHNHPHETTIKELEGILRQIYCGSSASAEFSYIEDLEEREWLALHFEQLHGQTIGMDERKQIAQLLIKSQAWDNFMATKFPTVKRYGGEGAESLLAFFWKLLQSAGQEEIEQLVVAMPHRGRTALQTILLKMRPVKVFHKLSGKSEFPEDCTAMSDVISHFHISEDFVVNGRNIRCSLVRNPSHLEAANPVAMGKARSKQQTLGDGAFNEDSNERFGSKVLNVILHGDAAFAGQGINQECLNMAYVPHFDVGGTVHLIVNNQVGFTTPADRGRSTDYCSDLAKTIQAPVIHVNGDDPEMVALVTEFALRYQRHFRKDIFIDMNCFRRWGHNELDDPTFTNPSTYKIIKNRSSVPDLYAQKLASELILSKEDAENIRSAYMDHLSAELSLVPNYEPEQTYFQKQWSSLSTATDAITYWDTGLDYSTLNYIGHKSVELPTDFNVHPHLLKTHIEARLKKLNAGEKIDWATAEALAIGSLMLQGYNVRLSGEDVGRGTFSHRHVMLVDQQTNEMYIPLNQLNDGQIGKLEVAHSILSEEAVLAYEYGMAIDNPRNLIIWEAQFGDFANGAQIIIDNFIISGETKWMDSNGLVILLPHGYDGAASEHSSCRIERFLQLCDSKETKVDSDNVNVNIVNPTTPAQYFHVLRRQMLRNFRKPLIVVAPKTLLRLSAATSNYLEFQPGTGFKNILGDETVNPNDVSKVILCSGKHFYALDDVRQSKGITDTAIIRLESLCPFPIHEIQEELSKYKNVKRYIWSQEEHRNMGAWSFVRPRFEYLFGKQLNYCGRCEAATSATGIGIVHKREVEEILTSPFN